MCVIFFQLLNFSNLMVQVIDIEKLTLLNNKKGPVFIFTDRKGKGGRIQIAVSSLKKGESIPWETHDHVTQFIRVEAGEGYVQTNGPKSPKKKLRNGSAFTISSHTPHIIVCTGKSLKFYSIYAKDATASKWVH